MPRPKDIYHRRHAGRNFTIRSPNKNISNRTPTIRDTSGELRWHIRKQEVNLESVDVALGLKCQKSIGGSVELPQLLVADVADIIKKPH